MGVNSCHWSVDVRNICLFVCLFVPNPKDVRFKEMKMYLLDVNGEYSGDRKYLTVEHVNTSGVE